MKLSSRDKQRSLGDHTLDLLTSEIEKVQQTKIITAMQSQQDFDGVVFFSNDKSIRKPFASSIDK